MPYLHLIHCLLDDEAIRAAYICSFNVMTRKELDGRNSEMNDPSVFQMIADKWNNPESNPSSEELFPDLHTSFMQSRSLLGWSEVSMLTPATAEKVKQKLSQMKAKLIFIITNWETSGQGDGGLYQKMTTQIVKTLLQETLVIFQTLLEWQR